MAATNATSAARLAARLAFLPHEAVVALAAQLCAENRNTIRLTEACLAKHFPTPQWAIESVLLSDDILPHIFAHIELKDGAAATVCTAWRSAWVATDEQRRGLRPAAISYDLKVNEIRACTTLPGGHMALFGASNSADWLLVVDSNLTTVAGPVDYILSGSSEGCEHAESGDGALFCNSGSGSYTGIGSAVLDRLELTNDERIFGARLEYEAGENTVLGEMCFARNQNTLFVNIYGHVDDDGRSIDEIVALDATTLTERFRLGRGLFRCVIGMAALGNELFVCDTDAGRIHVFSMSGEHLRNIGAEMRRPAQIVAHKDRLFTREEMGIIFVLAPDGEVLQKYTMKGDDGLTIHCISDLLVLGNRLIVRCEMKVEADRLLALKGI